MKEYVLEPVKTRCVVCKRIFQTVYILVMVCDPCAVRVRERKEGIQSSS